MAYGSQTFTNRKIMNSALGFQELQFIRSVSRFVEKISLIVLEDLVPCG